MPGFGKRLWLPFASGGYAALLVGLRGRPSLEADAGVFLSVAGRLLRGDRLYVNVVDNKDPFFFYAHTAALAVLGWRGPFLLDVVWLTLAAASTWLLLEAIGAPRLTAALGFVAFPLLLTGVWYYAGYSMLAGLAFVPLIGLLWLRGGFAPAGALFAVGLLFKVNLALVLASAPSAFLLLRLPAGPIRAQIVRTAAGFGAVVAATVAVLAVRGELHGYLENLSANVAYSRNVLSATGRPTGIIGHMQVAAEATGKPVHFALIVAALLLTGLLAIRTLLSARSTGASAQGSPVCVLAALFLCSAVATAVTLALTASWEVHDQMLAYPGLMLVAFLAATFAGAGAGLRGALAACATAGVAVALLGGATVAPRLSSSSWLEAGRSDTAELLERAARDRFPTLRRITFVHLGQNDEHAVAAFLNGKFKLACPMIAQYVFTPDLPSVLRCIRAEKPRLVFTTPLFRVERRAPAAWNRFVADGSSLLGSSYEPALTERTRSGLTEVFSLRGGHPAAAQAPVSPGRRARRPGEL
jgi:hypothetical protein